MARDSADIRYDAFVVLTESIQLTAEIKIGRRK